MTPIDRFERQLPFALTDLADPHAPDYLTDILGRTARTRQRPAWASLERWLPMDLTSQRVAAPRLPWRQLGILALLAVLAAMAFAAFVGSRARPAPLFGPAANGVIPYAIDGDIFAGDPISGVSEVVLAGPTYDYDPAFSRDGTRIAFTRRVDPTVEGVEQLMTMRSDGTGINPVTTEPLTTIRWWDWAPDGRSLVVVHEPRGSPVFQVFDADGIVAPRTLADGMEVDVPVFRPPHGTEILFRGQVGNAVGLFVINADGTGQHTIIEPTSTGVDQDLRQPRYSPDGSLIAYNLWDQDPGVMRFYVMNADGTGRRELGASPDIHHIASPAWSNDGTRIAVQIARSPGNVQTFAVIDVRTNKLVETGPILTQDGGPIDWAPDDSLLLMVPTGDGARQLFLDPAGGPWTEAPWDSDSFPNWQRKAP